MTAVVELEVDEGMLVAESVAEVHEILILCRHPFRGITTVLWPSKQGHLSLLFTLPHVERVEVLLISTTDGNG